ncbi:MAG TPA: exo-alpha-sialidase [Cytophagaceae bacterium]
MKGPFVFLTATLLIFLLNSFFLLKTDKATEKPKGQGQSEKSIGLHQSGFIGRSEEVPFLKLNRNNSEVANIVFKSSDGGQTWQDISEGLPDNLLKKNVNRDGFFADDSGLYIRDGNGIYHRKANSTAPFWKKEIFPDKQGSIGSSKNGILAFNHDGEILQKTYGTSVWAPMYTDFLEKVRVDKVGTLFDKPGLWSPNTSQENVRTVFETTGGTVFIGTDKGLFKSSNSGKSWKHVHFGGSVIKLVESNGVLLSACQGGILRSVDDGETWAWVINEGGGIAVETIDRGFAAISYNTITQSRRIHISFDGGKTWKAIAEGLQFYKHIPSIKQIGVLPPSMYISSIKQVGQYLICGHADGIFRSSDMGKTWKLLLPSIGDKVYNLSVSGNVIYAIPTKRGC